jgi:GH15 family glucan-1,4-alpha-glucosidase
MIGDCRTAALVSCDGSVDWLCVPHFSGPALFGRLLDEDAGHCSIRPCAAYRATRRYLDGAAVLETVFETANGSARLLDALILRDGVSPIGPMLELMRVIEADRGVELLIEVRPRPDYGRKACRLRHRNGIGWSFTWNNEVMNVRSDVALLPAGDSLRGVTSRGSKAKYRISLSYDKANPTVFPPLGSEADVRLQETIAWWGQWSERCSCGGPYRNAVIRSAITLKQLTYALSGAVVAAPTTSLPEAVGGELNWDYRYCWLRDAGMTVQALVGVGFHEDAWAYLGWLLHATRLTWPKLQVVYDIYGRTELEEKQLEHLSGYRNSRPVRIGNQAHDQLQLDAYGSVILAAETLLSAGMALDATEVRMLRGLGQTVCTEWRKADNGIWEIRGPRRQYTFSKIMCWVALDRLLSLHKKGAVPLGSLAGRFREQRDEIARLIEEQAFNRDLHSYVSELNGDRVAAELLLMAVLGYIEPHNPRFVSTFELIMRRLGRNGLLYRYEPGYAGFETLEATFGICTFWAIQVLAARGQIDAAERMLENVWSHANDVGLFGEEMDAGTGMPLGNFPQGFTHVGLINAVLAIERAKCAGQ